MRLSALSQSGLLLLVPIWRQLCLVTLSCLVYNQAASAAANSSANAPMQSASSIPEFDGADDFEDSDDFADGEVLDSSNAIDDIDDIDDVEEDDIESPDYLDGDSEDELEPSVKQRRAAISTNTNRLGVSSDAVQPSQDNIAQVDEIEITTDGQLGANATNNVTSLPAHPQAIDPVSKVPLNTISPTTLKTFVEVIDLVRREYVDSVSDEVLLNDAMSGMLTKLDSHAEFLDAEAYESLRAFTQGDVGEVGLQAEYQSAKGHWVVTSVVANSPAAKEHIRVGDYLHQINEVKLTDRKNNNDIKQLLAGLAGTQVNLVVSREGRRKRTITLQRNQTREQEVRVRLQEGVAIVKLPVFQNNSRQNILTALTKLNAPVSGLVIDVRDNPGGVLEAAVDIAGLFMSETPVVQIEGRQGVERILTTSADAALSILPVIILQNRYSASAAEVLASSLQTQKRAQIVGETSYGKGSVQSVIPVNDEQAIKLTVAHYLTADGRQIDDIGVTPDIELKGEEDLWEQQAVTLMLAKKRPSGVSFVLRPSK
ncbi:S41 family peptidase [Psychrobacter pygoscelis]|uniref:S41 family peptidase n=1 Tax=Psychrobacter pygoscelis TaxID=2488563 RepID=UPI001F61D52E|nr:S41 family peptidase [Psychrobacter pygoscelis]